jgi:hypothetical protein
VSSDHQERTRVRSRIGSLILEFYEFRLHINATQFHMDDLKRFVENRAPYSRIAPDSPGRILRQLRQHRLLNYKVVSRRQSLYQVLPVERPAEQAGLFAARAS